MSEKFDLDYYENGVSKGVSGYTNYHWIPYYVLPLANQLKKDLKPARVLDYGCAKGFLVKAFRLLDVEAYGFDISEYAVKNADPLVKDFLTNDFHFVEDYFDLVVAKDTLEHVPYEELQNVLGNMKLVTNDYAFVVVPLGDGKTFRIREFELDKTHIIREDEEWWMKQFAEAGFEVDQFYYDYPGSKSHWLKVCPIGNGTFILRKKK